MRAASLSKGDGLPALALGGVLAVVDEESEGGGEGEAELKLEVAEDRGEFELLVVEDGGGLSLAGIRGIAIFCPCATGSPCPCPCI